MQVSSNRMAAIDNPQYASAARIVARLRSSGHQAYFAGGCVRDLLLGRAPQDYDVATSATPDDVVAMFPKTFTVGAHFGVVLVVDDIARTNAQADDVAQEVATEVATFRNDGSYSDGRHPDAVRFSSDPREDVFRRDFTINGMLLDPSVLQSTGDPASAVLDFVGGIDDLRDRMIRAIGDPYRRFDEDKLRMLRAIRFAARLRFRIDHSTFAAIQRLAPEIAQVSCERVRDELTLILTEGGARTGLDLLDASGLLREVLPEAVRMQGVAQPPEFHPEGDVWVHTLLLLDKLPAGCPATLAWGALLHDIGKPATFRAPQSPGDRIRFNGHVEVGVRIAQQICHRLRFSNEDTAQIAALVANHMRFGDVMKMKQSTLKRFLRLPEFEQHLALHRMDCLSAHGDLTLYDFAKREFETTPEEQVSPPLLVTGRDLIAAGYKPGPQFKTMLELAEDAQLEGRIATTEEGLRLLQNTFPG